MKPTLFSFGPIHIYSYGTLVALGVLVALGFLLYRARREGFPKTADVYDLIFVTVVSGFLGARIFYVVQNIHLYSGHLLSILAFWEGGLIYFGGSVGALIGLWIFAKVRRLSYLGILDFLLPAVALAHAFGRIGCFLNGCCYGTASDLPWAVSFPHLPHPVHPTQLYEAAFNLGLFWVLYAYYPKRRFTGQITCFYFLFYGAGRFILEFWRADNPAWHLLTYNQWLSLILGGVFGLMLMVYARRRA